MKSFRFMGRFLAIFARFCQIFGRFQNFSKKSKKKSKPGRNLLKYFQNPREVLAPVRTHLHIKVSDFAKFLADFAKFSFRCLPRSDSGPVLVWFRLALVWLWSGPGLVLARLALGWLCGRLWPAFSRTFLFTLHGGGWAFWRKSQHATSSTLPPSPNPSSLYNSIVRRY